jgi:glycosyltransferase involved in cell wall biosynthesis
VRETPINVLLLAARLGPVDSMRVRRVVERLQRLEIHPRLISGQRSVEPRESWILESPGLFHRLGRFWTIRRLGSESSTTPDLIHAIDTASAPTALELAERWRLPYLVTIDDFPPPRFRLRLSERWCQGLITHDGDVAQDLIAGMRVPPDRVSVIPFGIEPTCAAASNVAARGRVPVVGTASALVSGSGAATFLQAALRVAATAPEAEFVVAGSGRGEADHRRLADRLGIADRVTFADDLGRIRAFWELLHVFCLPARSASEGRALATALVHGVPSVASNVPGLRSWIEDGDSGLLVPPADADALAAAITDLLRHPDKARRLAERGRRRASLLADPDREAQALNQVYRRALGRPLHSESGGANALAASA